jgi:O-antigen ligase
MWLAPVAIGAHGAPGVAAPTAPSASQPNERLIAFFRSPAGVASEVIALALGALAWTLGSARWLERQESTGRVLTTKSARKRARRRHPVDQPPNSIVSISRVLAGLATAAALILPMTFSILIGEDVFALPKTVGLWVFGIAIGSTLIASVLAGARPSRPGLLELSAAAFLGLTALATLTSVDPAHSVIGERLQYQGLFSAVMNVLLFTAAAVSLTTILRVRLLAVAVLTSATVAAAYALVQWFGFDPIWAELYKDRVFSTVGQANALATTLGAGVISASALLAITGRRRRAAIIASAALCIAALVLTFSRGGYVAFGFGVVVAALVVLPGLGRIGFRRISRPVVGGLGAAMLIVGIVVFAWQPANDLVGRVAARTASIANAAESSNQAHLDLWTVGLRIAADHPALGTGPDTFPVVFPQYRDVVLAPDRAAFMARFRPESPHNVYLAIASGAGFPALVAFVVFVASCLWLGIRVVRGADLPVRLAIGGLLGALTVHLITIVFMTAEPATFALLWILLGAVVGLSRTLVARTEEKEVAPTR